MYDKTLRNTERIVEFLTKPEISPFSPKIGRKNWQGKMTKKAEQFWRNCVIYGRIMENRTIKNFAGEGMI